MTIPGPHGIEYNNGIIYRFDPVPCDCAYCTSVCDCARVWVSGIPGVGTVEVLDARPLFDSSLGVCRDAIRSLWPIADAEVAEAKYSVASDHVRCLWGAMDTGKPAMGMLLPLFNAKQMGGVPIHMVFSEAEKALEPTHACFELGYLDSQQKVHYQPLEPVYFPRLHTLPPWPSRYGLSAIVFDTDTCETIRRALDGVHTPPEPICIEKAC